MYCDQVIDKLHLKTVLYYLNVMEKDICANEIANEYNMDYLHTNFIRKKSNFVILLLFYL